MAYMNNPKQKGSASGMHKDATMRDPLTEEQKANARRVLEQKVTPDLIEQQKENARRTLEKRRKQGGGE